MIKKLLLISLITLCTTPAYAETFEVLIRVRDQHLDKNSYGGRQGFIQMYQPNGTNWGSREIAGANYGIMRVHDITASELDFLVKSPHDADNELTVKVPSRAYIDLEQLKLRSSAYELWLKTSRDPTQRATILDLTRQEWDQIIKMHLSEPYDFDRTTNTTITLYDLGYPKWQHLVAKLTDVLFHVTEVFAAVTSGTFSVRAGGDYTTINGAAGDVGSPLVGDLTFNIDGDVTETSDTNIDVANLDGFRYKITMENNKHNGEPDSSFQITMGGRYSWVGEQDGIFEISHLDCIATDNTVPTTRAIGAAFVTNGTSQTVLYHDILLDMNDPAFDGTAGRDGIDHSDGDTETVRVYNNKVWDSRGRGIEITAGVTNGTVENNTVTRMQSAGSGFGINGGSSTFTYDNNLITECDANWQNTASATGRNNAGDDDTGQDADFSTGSGNLDSTTDEVTSTTEFTSIDDTNSAFLELKADAKSVDAGRTGTFASVSINQLTRADEGTAWDIGSEEFDVAAAAAAPIRRILFSN